VGVGQDLGLDVPGTIEIALDEALAAPERGNRLADRALEQGRDLVEGARHLETPAAAAERRLDRHGQAVLLREGDDLAGVGHRLGRAGHQRRTRALRDVPGGDLVAEVADGLRGRADPGETGVEHGLGELGVLGEEAVTGVHRVGAAAGGDVEQLVDAQIAVGRGVATQRERLVGQPGGQAVAVAVGIDGDAGETRVLTGPDYPDGDLAPVGDQYLAHGLSLVPGTDSSTLK
jgi:hypothetical protein